MEDSLCHAHPFQKAASFPRSAAASCLRMRAGARMRVEVRL